MLKILFTRQYTNETIFVMLWFYGIAPNFDAWVLGNGENMSLPDGITYSISASTLEFSTDSTYSANLTIVASPNATVGSFKVILGVLFYPSHTGYGISATGEAFTLEIAHGLPATDGINFDFLLVIIGFVVVVIALIGLAVVKYRRKNLSKTNQPPPPHPSTLVFLFPCFLFSHLSIDRTVVERERTKWSLIFLIMTLLGSFLLSLLPIDARTEGGNPPQSIG